MRYVNCTFWCKVCGRPTRTDSETCATCLHDEYMEDLGRMHGANGLEPSPYSKDDPAYWHGYKTGRSWATSDSPKDAGA